MTHQGATKTKPVAHLKKGETLVLTAWDGSKHRHKVAKVEDDHGLVRVHVPPSITTLIGGKTVESSPSAVYVVDRRENVAYEAAS